jgi:hypothetical protein
MARLIEEVQTGVRKDAHYVVSIRNIRKLDQIERLSRAIRERMKRQ